MCRVRVLLLIGLKPWGTSTHVPTDQETRIEKSRQARGARCAEKRHDLAVSMPGIKPCCSCVAAACVSAVSIIVCSFKSPRRHNEKLAAITRKKRMSTESACCSVSVGWYLEGRKYLAAGHDRSMSMSARRRSPSATSNEQPATDNRQPRMLQEGHSETL